MTAGRAVDDHPFLKALKHRESVRHTQMGITREKNRSHSSTSPCSHLRAAYHNCFNRWYSEKFVKGHWEKEECISEWQKYRACLSEHLDDKHLSRFLEAETVVDAAIKDDSGNPVDGAATRVAQ
ncbi:uncharacterized protein At4g33100 isoform X3 [Juglans regia]|uniref:Uncharacterized protein At4g33100 isoform X3 n=1 Tax=Juglans regia TaxID=51240 RepID=A0A6P9ERE2_JUGRE|nr:uncharacterized protein At4g33100 isoform X3 [Juglans regia]